MIWIIDDEWENYKPEQQVFDELVPDEAIVYSGADFEKDMDRYAAEADAVICQISIPMTREVVSRLSKCKVISVYGVGYDNVDVKAASEKNIKVTNVPDYCTEDVSDYVIAAIYHCNKTLLRYAAEVKESPWGAMAAKTLIKRIGGSVLLIAGFGNIGRMIARKANAMSMRVLCYDPYVSDEQAAAQHVEKVLLADGLAQADYVSLNMKLTPETADFMNYECFCRMKPTAYLINASRGGTVNEEDLIRAVSEKKLAGACLDVIKHEPPKPDDPLLNTENIFVTPHISYLTQTSLDELQAGAARNAAKILRGETVLSVVNKW